MLVFNRRQEHGRYVKETHDFIGDEIRYAAQMVRYFGRAENRDARDRLFVDSALAYLASLSTAYETARTEEPEEQQHLDTIFLNTFPDLIRDLTTALFQRNEAQPPRMLRAPHASVPFAPSEVTLEYPVTIRAAEALNQDYHRRVADFYDSAHTVPPLVNLSGSTAATLQLRDALAAAVADAELRHETSPPTMLARNERMMHHILNLSCITLPRWSSQHVRTYASAAHEHMHRVLERVHMLVRGVVTEYYDNPAHARADLHFDWRSTDREVKERAITAVEAFTAPLGTDENAVPIVALFQLTYALFQRVWDFLLGQKVRWDPNLVNDDRRQRAWAEELQGIAWDHTVELLADAGALVIGGPAFAFAYRTIFTPNTSNDLDTLFDRTAYETPRHPPALLRSHLHAIWLNELGFVDVSSLLRSACADDWTAAMSPGQPHAADLAAYASFVTKDLSETFSRALDLIGGGGAPESYDLRKRSPAPAGTALVVDPTVEQKLLQRWDAITHQVEVKRRYLVADMGALVVNGEDVGPIMPADAINAIWWKRIREGNEDPKNRLAWRVALRNCYGSIPA